MRAYEVYCKVFSPQAAMVTGHCRGGFGTGELIAFLYAHSFPQEEWRERVDEALTTVLLKTNGYINHEGISGDLSISMPDEQSPEWNTFYLVTVEQVTPEIVNGHYADGFHKLIADRKAKDAGAVALKSGRKFRE